MYSSGAFLVLVALMFSPQTHVNQPGIVAVAGLAAVSSVMILLLGPRYTVGVSQTFTAAGSVLVATIIVLAHGTFLSIVYGMLLVWVAQFGAVFYRFRSALAQWLWAAALHALAITVLPSEHRVATWALINGTGAVVVLSYRLIERTSARLRGVMEHSGGIVLVIDPDLKIKYAGGAIERLLASTPGELTGKSLLPIVHPDDWTTVHAAVHQVTESKDIPTSFEVRLQRDDGASLFTEGNIENAMHNSSLDGIVITLRDVTERKILEDQLLHQAFHDPLTNLPNRALFADRVERILSRRKNPRCSLLFVDLDGFKAINDSFGHEVGDLLLAEVGKRLLDGLRAEDTAARLGGDEFAVLLDGISTEKEAVVIGERTLKAVQAPYALLGQTMSVGASIGITIAIGRTNPGDLLREADVAMYMAKRDGRNQCHVFNRGWTSDDDEALLVAPG
jgi:diguanylate cyclase (GGDEF)-like protein/PAS domain S-box-containing protein